MPLTESCTKALAAIERDPLNLPEDVEAHLRTCPACAETRVLWLAQEPTEHALAPAGYFEALPERILRKLPASRTRRFWRSARALWAAAAVMAVAAGIGGYMAGRANRVPVVEASVKPAEVSEQAPEAPFLDGDEELHQLLELTPDQAKILVQRLQSPKP